MRVYSFVVADNLKGMAGENRLRGADHTSAGAKNREHRPRFPVRFKSLRRSRMSRFCVGELLSLSEDPASNARTGLTTWYNLYTAALHMSTLNLSGNRSYSERVGTCQWESLSRLFVPIRLHRRTQKKTQKGPRDVVFQFFWVITQQSRGLPEQAKARLGSWAKHVRCWNLTFVMLGSIWILLDTHFKESNGVKWKTRLYRFTCFFHIFPWNETRKPC